MSKDVTITRFLHFMLNVFSEQVAIETWGYERGRYIARRFFNRCFDVGCREQAIVGFWFDMDKEIQQQLADLTNKHYGDSE